MPFLIYLLQVCIYSGVLWGIYCLVLRGTTAHPGSRVYLLLAALLPPLLPFIRFRAESVPGMWMPHYQLPEFRVVAASATAPHTAAFEWNHYYAYAFIAMMLVCRYLVGYVRIIRTIVRGNKALINDRVVYTNTGIGPGTIGRRIFFPGDIYDDQILRHEEAHMLAGHRYDLLLMQALTAVCWINPFAWIMLRELKMVHEFEADAKVTDGDNISGYANLLLSQVFGLRSLNTVHSFFHHPVKRRITMLQHAQRPHRAIRLVAVAFTLTGAFAATVLMAQKVQKHAPQKNAAELSGPDSVAFIDRLQHAIDSFVKANPQQAIQRDERGLDSFIAKNPVLTTPEIQPDGRAIYKFVDQMPAFGEDLSAYLSNHLHYPDSARAHGQQGRSVIQFIVDEQGKPTLPTLVRSSGSSLLDDEAIRVVTAMPMWKPGKLKGSPVAVYFTLPVTFKLD